LQILSRVCGLSNCTITGNLWWPWKSLCCLKSFWLEKYYLWYVFTWILKRINRKFQLLENGARYYRPLVGCDTWPIESTQYRWPCVTFTIILYDFSKQTHSRILYFTTIK